MAWPSIASPHLKYPEEWDDPAMRSEMEGGYTLTRPRYTRIRRTWQLEWRAMSATDYALLTAFYVSTHGGSDSFAWTTPTDGASKTVRFSGPLKAAMIVPANNVQVALYSVSCSLEEV